MRGYPMGRVRERHVTIGQGDKEDSEWVGKQFESRESQVAGVGFLGR